jgi:peptidoglycan/LPS O-acetylase OafA/YrhL
MMVVFCHCTLAFQPALLSGKPEQAHFASSIWIARTPLIFFWNPELGVAIFFVLSGFVLAASVTAKSVPLAELALRRWIRLSGPILGTSLLIWGFVQAGLLYNQPMAAQNGSDWLAGNFAWTAFEPNDLGVLVWQSLIDIFARGRHWWNFALWTMPIEFWGSIGLFALYAVLRWAARPPALRLAVALIVLALTWRTPYGGFAAGAGLFEAGCLLRGVAKFRALCWTAGAGLLLAGFVLGGTPWNLFDTLYWPSFVWLSARIDNPILAVHRLGAVYVVAAVLVLPPLRHVLTLRPFRFLGRVSFIVYLMHITLICWLFSWLMLRLTPLIGYNRASALGLLIFLIVLMAVAVVATRLFDQTSIRLSRQVGAVVPRAINALAAKTWSRLAVVWAR